MLRDEILKKLAEHGADLRRYKVRRLGIFGSAARDELRPESDLDILVELNDIIEAAETPPTLWKLVQNIVSP